MLTFLCLRPTPVPTVMCLQRDVPLSKSESSSKSETLARGTLKGIVENEAVASITGDEKDHENEYVNKTSLRIVV